MRGRGRHPDSKNAAAVEQALVDRLVVAIPTGWTGPSTRRSLLCGTVCRLSGSLHSTLNAIGQWCTGLSPLRSDGCSKSFLILGFYNKKLNYQPAQKQLIHAPGFSATVRECRHHTSSAPLTQRVVVHSGYLRCRILSRWVRAPDAQRGELCGVDERGNTRCALLDPITTAVTSWFTACLRQRAMASVTSCRRLGVEVIRARSECGFARASASPFLAPTSTASSPTPLTCESATRSSVHQHMSCFSILLAAPHAGRRRDSGWTASRRIFAAVSARVPLFRWTR